jgi:cell division protein ZapA (FtsZ GTPase activity inhibitor)
MKIFPILLISLVFCNISNIKQNSAISVFKCLFNDEKFLNSLKNILSSLREHMDDKDVLALIKSLLENVPVAFNEINLCLNSEPLLNSWWDDVVDKVEDIVDDIKDAFNSLTDYVKELGHDFENIKKDIINQMESIGEEISTEWNNIKNKIVELDEKILEKIKKDKKAVKKIYDNVSSKMKDINKNAKDKVEGILSDVSHALDIIQQAWDSLPKEKKEEILNILIDNVLEYGEEAAITACCAATAETLVGCPICYIGITIAVDEIEKLSKKYNS